MVMHSIVVPAFLAFKPDLVGVCVCICFCLVVVVVVIIVVVVVVFVGVLCVRPRQGLVKVKFLVAPVFVSRVSRCVGAVL